MRSHVFWDQFADITVNRLVNPGKGEPFLIVADPKNDLNLAEALLIGRSPLRRQYNADHQRLVRRRHGQRSGSDR